MLILLQIKTPMETVAQLQRILEDLRNAHRLEIEEVLHQGQLDATSDKPEIEIRRLIKEHNDKQEAIHRRAPRLTMQNILRLFLTVGIRHYRDNMTKLLEDIDKTGIKRGRPGSNLR